MTARDRATAANLVRLLDSLGASRDHDYLALLQYSATARQARKLVDQLLAASSASSQQPKTLLNLDARLSKAEQHLARLAPVQSSSALSPPAEVIRAYRDSDPLLASDLAAFDALAVPSPPPSPTLPPDTGHAIQAGVEIDGEGEVPRRDSEPARGHDAVTSNEADDHRALSDPSAPPLPSQFTSDSVWAEPLSVPPHSKPLGRATSPPGPAAESSSSSSLDPTLTSTRVRQRRPVTMQDSDPDEDGGHRTTGSPSKSEKPVPAYLAAKRARAAAAEKVEQKKRDRTAGHNSSSADLSSGQGDDDAGKAAADLVADPETVVKKLDDLIPADSVPFQSSSSGGGGSGVDLLGQHHALQTSLLSSLTSLSGALKQSTLSFSDNLAKDKEVVTRAQEQLERSEQGMKQQQARLKDVRGKSRGTTCWTLGLLAVVFVFWFLTFLLIKVT
ncbi:hypothetical protein JCM3774_005740 [Rhodotorula dairenensis]